jgi:hypothetical protein
LNENLRDEKLSNLLKIYANETEYAELSEVFSAIAVRLQ